MERLQKALADVGVGSRRYCERLIAQGRVSVNGVVVEIGTKVTRGVDEIHIDGQLVEQVSCAKRYVMLNKPRGYVSTVHDEGGRATVMELVADVQQRIYPVGRLDRDTEGLLLFTNDGDVSYALTHPKHLVDKVYIAAVRFPPTDDALRCLAEGVMLEDGMTSPAKVRLHRDGCIELTIREGRKRQVRRMLAAVGCPVEHLRRVRVGPLLLGDLPLGKHRDLTRQEVALVQEIVAHAEMYCRDEQPSQ